MLYLSAQGQVLFYSLLALGVVSRGELPGDFTPKDIFDKLCFLNTGFTGESFGS
jgi:hypothetical protein